MEPNTLHFSVYVWYIVNMALHLSWDFLWDREQLGVSNLIQNNVEHSLSLLFTFDQWALLFIFLMLVTAAAPLIITHVLLQRNRQSYIDSNR